MNTKNKNEIKEIIIFFRLDMYNNGLLCGGKAIRDKMMCMDVHPLPSVSTIYRILKDNYLTNGRTGYYPGEEIYMSRDYTFFWKEFIKQIHDNNKKWEEI